LAAPHQWLIAAPTSTPSTRRIDTVDCVGATSSACVFTQGDVVFGLDKDGRAFQLAPLESAQDSIHRLITGVSCDPSASLCLALANGWGDVPHHSGIVNFSYVMDLSVSVHALRFDPQYHWQFNPFWVPEGQWQTSAVGGFRLTPSIPECVSSTTCYALGPYVNELIGFPGVYSPVPNSHLWKTTDRGHSWHEVSLGARTGRVYFTAMDCTSASTCWLGGVNGEVIRTTNGGATWKPVGPPSLVSHGAFDDSPVLSIYCAAQSCRMLALDQQQRAVYSTTDDGASWSRVDVSEGFNAQSMSCRSFSECYVVGVQGSPNTGPATIYRFG